MPKIPAFQASVQGTEPPAIMINNNCTSFKNRHYVVVESDSFSLPNHSQTLHTASAERIKNAKSVVTTDFEFLGKFLFIVQHL